MFEFGMVSSSLVHRIKTFFSNDSQEASPTSESLENETDSTPLHEQQLKMLDSLLQIDSLPHEYRKVLKLQHDLYEHIIQDSSHWNRVHSIVKESKHGGEYTFQKELRETEELAQAIRDAFEADYKYYARGHHLSKELINHSKEANEVGDEVIKIANEQVVLFDVAQEFAMTNSWRASIHYNGLRLMFLNPDDELGNLILDHEMKRRTSDLILSTTTVVETVGQILLGIHRDQDYSGEKLGNIIDMLAADDLISLKEKKAMHSVRESRNRIAHDMEKRTTLDWIGDFKELVLDCFTSVEAVEYPICRRLKTELPPEVAEEYVELVLPTFEEDREWDSVIQDFE